MNFGHEATQSRACRALQFSLLTRRGVIRAALLAGTVAKLGTSFSFAQAVLSGLTPAAQGEDGSIFLAAPNWKPVFLDERQNETVIALSEVIIPATDTPGAKEALVNRYLDLLLSVQLAEFQKQFLDALGFVDIESQKQFGKDFRALTSHDQISLLTPWAYARQASHWTAWQETHEQHPDLAQDHFELLKTLISEGYYGSEIGQKDLGWDREITHGPYKGCTHSTATHK
jgi:hypothetical protein